MVAGAQARPHPARGPRALRHGTDARPRPAGTALRWVTSLGTIQAIAALAPRVASVTFGTPNAIALGGWPGSTTGRAWASFAAFAEEAGDGRIPQGVAAVMYDPEGWEATPAEERRDPIPFLLRFAALAREGGYFSIATPHPNLVEVSAGRVPRATGASRESAFLRSGIVEAAAGADAFEVQAQRLQAEPVAYRAFVSEAARQARAANPDVVVLTGLSTHPGYPATERMLYEAWESVNDVVDGCYLSLAKGRLPRVAARFLRALAGRE
jgi:hypothetical protein